MINNDSRPWKPHPQRLTERRGRVNRHDLKGQAPLQGPGEQPVPDALVVTAVNQALRGWWGIEFVSLKTKRGAEDPTGTVGLLLRARVFQLRHRINSHEPHSACLLQGP